MNVCVEEIGAVRYEPAELVVVRGDQIVRAIQFLVHGFDDS